MPKGKRIPNDEKIEFLDVYSELAQGFFKGDQRGAGRELAKLAREELGYSQNTYWLDICFSLRKTYDEVINE